MATRSYSARKLRPVLIWWYISSLVGLSSLSYATETVVTDKIYKDACGPIACVVALRSLGVECSLSQVCHQCEWGEGRSVSFANMKQTLDSYRGVECFATRLKPRELIDLLSRRQTVVILAMSTGADEINHAVCATGVNENDEVKFVDYPELLKVRPLGDIVPDWDGTALVVQHSPMSRTISNVVLYVLPCLSVLLIYSAYRKRNA